MILLNLILCFMFMWILCIITDAKSKNCKLSTKYSDLSKPNLLSRTHNYEKLATFRQ